MRHFKLVTIDRRGGACFQLKSVDGRTVIGTMKINPSKARHEMELSEDDYLKHARSLALLCKVPGAGVYVESIRDDAALSGILKDPLPPDTRFHRITKIAREEGIDLSGCKTNAERIFKINLHRENAAALAMAA